MTLNGTVSGDERTLHSSVRLTIGEEEPGSQNGALSLHSATPPAGWRRRLPCSRALCLRADISRHASVEGALSSSKSALVKSSGRRLNMGNFNRLGNSPVLRLVGGFPAVFWRVLSSHGVGAPWNGAQEGGQRGERGKKLNVGGGQMMGLLTTR